MNQDENDELWKLLGKARVPKERPYFAGKVMRAIRSESRDRAPAGFWVWLRRHWLAPATLGLVAAAAVVFFVTPGKPLPQQALADANPLAELAAAAVQIDEFDAAIDGLLVTEDNSVWLLADPSSLY